MYTERHEVLVTTASDGSATAYTPVLSGKIYGIHYVKNTFTNGVDFTITLEKTGETLWTQNDVNASVSKYPAAQVNKTDGVAAVSGTDPVLDRIIAARDRVKIQVASGGSVTNGTFHILVG